MDFEAILTEAHDAATAAILKKFQDGDKEVEFNCGFAWVTVSGNDAIARHCRSKLTKVSSAQYTGNTNRYGDKAYPKGWQWWKPGDWPTSGEMGFHTVYRQDMDFFIAGARAFVEVLAKYGIRADLGSRLD